VIGNQFLRTSSPSDANGGVGVPAGTPNLLIQAQNRAGTPLESGGERSKRSK
jgi:hypothetical protein